MKSRQRQRQVALAIVLAFLLTQLAGFLHLALEQHRVCADHGELVHAAAAELDGREHRPATGGPDGPGLAGAPEQREHAHCGILPAIQPKHAAAAQSPRPTPAIPELLGRAAPVAATARSAVPLLLLAPKHSPPA